MPRPESNRSVPGGGRGSGGGSFHFSVRSGSRAGGSCAGAAYDYITRGGEYDDPDRDPATYTESDNMPGWAEDNPRDFWDAADMYERENGRLYVGADFALPRGLEEDDQAALATTLAHELTDEEDLPYTLAIHAGRDADGNEHNPHVHLMISERKNDGISRPKEQWFRRANRTDPERGGATKSRMFHGREWVERARERWADLTNKTLERAGRDERVDHRSYARQGIDREPGEHYGPGAAHMVARGRDHDRLETAVDQTNHQELFAAVDRDLDDDEKDPRGGGRGAMSQDRDSERERRQRDEDELDRDPKPRGR